ncbi:MAG: hypothetical protein FXF47_04145 [Candidatus Mcinerneyibacterium aminivorans]|uniref:D-isomer specific 2-hydroxyacid dehydrogenase NAD-binding domain-containing protein n=1 Tax=Candidatus Mcinerneyibacterium aminivorans TaxID=2703815 RepID=A0A5D0MCK0_9BACT|nr:MAG: hypothetical protein FXF47_04145 [Candidatus Mcinerneyibacterium aminivorans]
MKVLCLIDYDKKLKNYFRARLNKQIKIKFLSKEKLDKVKNYEQFNCLIGHRIDKNDLEKFRNLKYYIIPFAGVPEKDRKNLKKIKNVILLNSHFNSIFVAEHAWALLLSLMKKIIPAHEKLKRGNWNFRYENNLSNYLFGKNLLLAGHGAIGKKIHNFAKSFNMNVLAVKKHESDKQFVFTPHKVKYLLPQIDIIISSLPLTKDTIHFFSFKEFDLIKKGVFVVNVGRGEIISQRALFNALENDKLGGAAIDTWWNYPKNKASRSNTFPADYPFNKFENFIFSPHRASHVENREEYRITDLSKILNSIINQKVVNKVEIDHGY